MFCLFYFIDVSLTLDVERFYKFWRSRIYFNYFVGCCFLEKKNKKSQFFCEFFGGGVPLGMVHMERGRT